MRNQAFAQTLRRMLDEQGKTASDLAKSIWGTTKDSEGYIVAKNRDRISVWLSGKAFPSPDNLQQLAETLGVKPEDLSPEHEDFDLKPMLTDLRSAWGHLRGRDAAEYATLSDQLSDRIGVLLLALKMIELFAPPIKEAQDVP